MEPSLAVLEETIARSIDQFQIVGFCLSEIRRRELYRPRFDSFEAYCTGRWGIYRSANIIDKMSMIEVVSRSLVTVEPRETREPASNDVIERHANKTITIQTPRAKEYSEEVAKRRRLAKWDKLTNAIGEILKLDSDDFLGLEPENQGEIKRMIEALIVWSSQL